MSNVHMDVMSKHTFRFLAAAVVGLLAVGTMFYHLVEKLSWLNAYYFSVITLSTVGYGDIVPRTAAGKLFTTLYIFIGVGLITTFFSVLVKRRAVRKGRVRPEDVQP
jgi:voltage-gated potassium channel